MTTSLASSPVLPIAAAGIAAALIFGTLSNGSSANADDAAQDPTAYVPVELPGSEPAANPAAPAANPATPAKAGGKVTTSCKANVCTITFPAEGGVAKVLGTTVTATKFYGDGITVTVGSKALVTNLTTPAKGGGYTVQATKVENGAASPHTVTVTKNK